MYTLAHRTGASVSFGDDIPAGTFHGGDDIPAGTFH